MRFILLGLLFAVPLLGQVSWVTFSPAPGWVGAAYSHQLQASSTQGSLTYSLTSGTLPPGISLSTSGLLSGVPTQWGTFPITVRAAASVNSFADRNFAFLVVSQPPPVTFFPTQFPSGTLAVPYRGDFGASGTIGEMQFSIRSGALPPGLRMERTNGSGIAIVGTPASAGRYDFTIRTLDSFNQSVDHNFTIVISSSLLTIFPDTLPAAAVGARLTLQLTGAGGTPPYRFEKVGGALNYDLTSSGEISFLFSMTGVINFSVAMTDALGARVEKTYSLAIVLAPIRVTSLLLPEVAAYEPYEARLSIMGGMEPYECSLVGGSLPSGLSLSRTCIVAGIAQQEGEFSFAISVRSAPNSGSSLPPVQATIRLTSRALPLTFTTPAEYLFGPYLLRDKQGVRTDFPRKIGVRGGKAPYTFFLLNSGGPSGLKLLTNGEWRGELEHRNGGSVTVEVLDSLGKTAQQEITVRAAGWVNTLASFAWAPGTVGEPYLQFHGRPSEELIPPVQYSVASGLPPGLSMLPNGTLTGQPTAAGTFSFEALMTGSDGKTLKQAVAIAVAESAIRLTNLFPAYAVAGRPYSGVLRAQGGTGPFQYLSLPGVIPPGLSLSLDGRLEGTTNSTGFFRFPLRVVDSTGRTTLLEASLAVFGSAVTITTPEQLTDAEVGRPFRMQFSATGGSSRYAFGPASCCAPLAIDNLGNYFGTPIRAGVYEFGLAATDVSSGLAFNINGVKLLRQTVREVPGLPKDFSSLVLAAARRDQLYSEWLGFEGAPTYSVHPDFPLPPGLSLSAAGQLSGRVSRLGTYSFPVLLEFAMQRGVFRERILTLSVIGSGPAITGSFRLPAGLRYSPYLAVLEIGGSEAPFTVSLQGGFLPAGLRLGTRSSGQVVVEGSSREVGVFTFSLLVSDRLGNRNSLNFELSVTDSPVPLDLDFSGVPNGIVGSPYMGTVGAVGGRPPYRLVVLSPDSMPGISMDLSGNLRGIPPFAGNFPFSVLVTDSLGYQVIASTRASVSPAKEALTARAIENPPPIMGQAYRAEIGIVGGRAPFDISLSRGSLPPGLRFGSHGLIEGFVLAPGTYSFGVVVRDADGQTLTRDLTLTVPAPLELAPARRLRLYDGRVGPLSGAAPIRFELETGTRGGLPPGIQLLSDGKLQGTPLVSGDFQFIVRGVDTRGTVSRMPMLLTVLSAGPLSFQESSLPGGSVGQGYRQVLNVSGTSGPLRFVLSDGALPPGLRLNATSGVIEGTTQREGTYPFIVQAIDSQNREESLKLEIVVAPQGSPRLAALLNSASYEARGIAPGELLTGFGEALGPEELAGLQLDSNGRVASITGGTRILANGVPMPMIYSSQTQLSAIAAWNTEGTPTFWVTVERAGYTSAPYRLKSVDAKPGFFTLDSSGTGLAAIVNPDGSINQNSNPARRGDTIVAYLTGAGAMDLAGPPGSVAAALSRLRLPVSVQIGGVDAEVQYIGNAPGLIEGVVQLNVKVPLGIATGRAPIRIKVGVAESPSGVFVAVQ